MQSSYRLLAAALVAHGLRATAFGAPSPAAGDREEAVRRGVAAIASKGATDALASGKLLAALGVLAAHVPPEFAPVDAAVALWAGARRLGPAGRAWRARAEQGLAPPVRKLALHRTPGGIPSLARGDPRFREICLTFDDGPCRHTKALLDVLAAHRARATFFLVGRNLAGHAEVAQRILRDGHAIGCHTFSHPPLGTLKDPAIAREVKDFKTALREALLEDYPCRLFRLPFNSGKGNARINRALAKEFSLLVDWSIDSRDWESRDSGLILDRVLSHCMKKGAILLLHENPNDPGVPARVDALLTQLEELQFRTVSLDELQGLDVGSVVRARLVQALQDVERGEVREAYRNLMTLSRDRGEAPGAAAALWLAGELAAELPDRREVIPEQVARYLAKHHAGSPFSPTTSASPDALAPGSLVE